MNCVTLLRVRIANPMVMDSYCRGGIVHIRGRLFFSLFSYGQSSTALWRFRVSTSNSPSDRSCSFMRYIYHTYAQQDIRVCEDDHLKLSLSLSLSRDDRFGQHIHTHSNDRTPICNAILYHFQITLSCGPLIVLNPQFFLLTPT